MNHFKNNTAEDRIDMIRATSQAMNLSEGIVEKDYWVCFVLDYLFSDSPWKSNLAFKGGTSLSKCYQIISRFSEDIDLVLDWRLLGYEPMEPYQTQSRNQQNIIKKEIVKKSNSFLANTIKPRLENDFSSLINEPFSFYLENEDTLCFDYPKQFRDPALTEVVRLEISALAAWSPIETVNIQSYTASQFPVMFDKISFTVTTTQAKRSFWEKISILHKTSYRLHSNLPLRYARHYYDVVMFYNSPFYLEALKDSQLRISVIEFNVRFYPGNEFHFELAKPGSFNLMPIKTQLTQLEQDYIAMQSMFFETSPPFTELLQILKSIEKEINEIDD